MTGPREWRHAEECKTYFGGRDWKGFPCDCGLSAVRDAIDQGHRVVLGVEGVEGRLVEMGAYERRGTYSDQAFRVEEP